MNDAHKKYYDNDIYDKLNNLSSKAKVQQESPNEKDLKSHDLKGISQVVCNPKQNIKIANNYKSQKYKY